MFQTYTDAIKIKEKEVQKINITSLFFLTKRVLYKIPAGYQDEVTFNKSTVITISTS